MQLLFCRAKSRASFLSHKEFVSKSRAAAQTERCAIPRRRDQQFAISIQSAQLIFRDRRRSNSCLGCLKKFLELCRKISTQVRSNRFLRSTTMNYSHQHLDRKQIPNHDPLLLLAFFECPRYTRWSVQSSYSTRDVLDLAAGCHL